jgi:hypothetical protein
MAKKQAINPDFIKPSIRANDEKHILEEIYESDPNDMPTLKAVGYVQIGTGKSSWMSYTITTKGKEVLSIDVDEPNVRAIAEESAKIAFVTSFVDQEF